MEAKHLDAVLADLRSNREILVANLADLDNAIFTLERLYGQAPLATLSRVRPAMSSPPPEPIAPKVIAVMPPAAVVPQESEHLPAPPEETTTIGLVEAIVKAARESKWDQPGLVRRVLSLRPGTTSGSAQAQTYSMLRAGRLHKGNDLIIRNVIDGRIENLPAPTERESRSPHHYSQYVKQ